MVTGLGHKLKSARERYEYTQEELALKCSDEEIKWIAQEKGDKSFWRLITKESINVDEQRLLDDYRQLNSQQKQLIDSMIQQMRSQP